MPAPIGLYAHVQANHRRSLLLFAMFAVAFQLMMAVGLAQKALDIARNYAGVRKQFGKLIGGFQLVQQDLAEIETCVLSSRLVCYNALAAIDRAAIAGDLVPTHAHVEIRSEYPRRTRSERFVLLRELA